MDLVALALAGVDRHHLLVDVPVAQAFHPRLAAAVVVEREHVAPPCPASETVSPRSPGRAAYCGLCRRPFVTGVELELGPRRC